MSAVAIGYARISIEDQNLDLLRGTGNRNPAQLAATWRRRGLRAFDANATASRGGAGQTGGMREGEERQGVGRR